MDELYQQGIQSLIVEGGAMTHHSFMEQGLWDEIRVETSPLQVDDGTPAPSIPSDAIITDCQEFDGNKITWWRNYWLYSVYDILPQHLTQCAWNIDEQRIWGGLDDGRTSNPHLTNI